ncbi:MAG: TIGR02996 domain-containing protein [Kofleriaceae bacterium]
MSARNPALEAQIAISASTDPAAYLVYADWLAEQGDPRGELITVSVALDKDPANATLVARARALHATHDAEWLGEAQHENLVLTWKHGFIDSALLGGADDDTPEITLGEIYARLAPLPVAALLRDLTFGAYTDDSGEPRWQTSWLVDNGVAPSLRRLAFDKGSYWDISWTHLDPLSPVYPLVPNLETLYLRIGHMSFGQIELPRLRDFEVYTGGFSDDNMASVVAANWPQLERLILRFGDSEDYGGTCALSDVLPLLASQRTPKLRHLGLGNAAFTDDLIEPLAKSPLVRQLATLDLSLGMMTDAGAQALARHADAFAHLTSINLGENYLTSDGIGAVKRALPSVTATAQKTDDDHRYCSINE